MDHFVLATNSSIGRCVWRHIHSMLRVYAKFPLNGQKAPCPTTINYPNDGFSPPLLGTPFTAFGGLRFKL